MAANLNCFQFSEKLKKLWIEKLSVYDKEEVQLRATLKQDSDSDVQNQQVQQFVDNLDKWREFLFGGNLPQVDFNGDVGTFVQVR